MTKMSINYTSFLRFAGIQSEQFMHLGIVMELYRKNGVPVTLQQVLKKIHPMSKEDLTEVCLKVCH